MQAEVFVLEADAAGLAVDQKADALPRSRLAHAVHRASQVGRQAGPAAHPAPAGAVLRRDRGARASTDPKLMKPGARVRAVLEVENQSQRLRHPAPGAVREGREEARLPQEGRCVRAGGSDDRLLQRRPRGRDQGAGEGRRDRAGDPTEDAKARRDMRLAGSTKPSPPRFGNLGRAQAAHGADHAGHDLRRRRGDRHAVDRRRRGEAGAGGDRAARACATSSCAPRT